MKEAVIVAGARTPVGKANRGSFKHVRSDDLGAFAVKETLRRAKQVEPEEIDDCLIGCAMPEAEQGMNMARNVSVLAGIPQSVPAVTINRYCASGLQTIAYGAERIMLGHAKAIIAGGAESMSMIPMGGHVVKPNPTLIDEAPEYYMSMGYTAEEVARQYGISREDQDAFAVESHKRAAAALANQRFSDEIVPVPVVEQHFGSNGTLQSTERLVEIDEGVRADTTIAALSKLKPAFQHKGTVTAGNSSQMSDGAAAVLLMDKEEAEARGLEPLVTFKSFAVAGVAPEVMGVGPIEAIPKAVRLAGLQLEEIGLFELNEAFASQALAVIRELGLDYDKVNVNGGAIALGHPLGCTGTKLTLSLIHEMRRRDERFGVVTMCIGGGMGAAAVFERH
ncbi:acetyl-CoA C-acetyltransferase [Shouchella clausii]|uniref:acetyl-CoA C-acyltransferase n=1 Tax=Shouchella clausii TaxID=79880 RepID=A0A268S1H4_SHOCL|nr:acetyl-CoA C-acetyltransferase [Shouchella clausii]PAD41289.1 acetyl-CoA acetyltransferase [Bacillus sp. 7520-S]MED4158528.1 acetyl-CoA C-acetyltransferase [Shouchella clausii]MED4177521.1 acetyl-CoA C-acetyltransferase [Shouchella clausii]PAF26349.1 acetyl-CoA acetyltransferase [Shouchella clausii]PTL24591.1 acetyl-CoA C-acetyltransferase [Shouchella clausii]